VGTYRYVNAVSVPIAVGMVPVRALYPKSLPQQHGTSRLLRGDPPNQRRVSTAERGLAAVARASEWSQVACEVPDVLVESGHNGGGSHRLMQVAGALMQVT
jgi:hypothetical protein